MCWTLIKIWYFKIAIFWIGVFKNTNFKNLIFKNINFEKNIFHKYYFFKNCISQILIFKTVLDKYQTLFLKNTQAQIIGLVKAHTNTGLWAIFFSFNKKSVGATRLAWPWSPVSWLRLTIGGVLSPRASALSQAETRGWVSRPRPAGLKAAIDRDLFLCFWRHRLHHYPWFVDVDFEADE